MLTAFLTSLAFVVLAETGDKTQLLAMAFATRYRWTTVLWAVLVATLLNHLLAVLAGTLLAKTVPMEWVRLAAALSFIAFGIWEMHHDRLEGEEKRAGRSPFWTVAVAFFIAEMGDKTQLATVALAARFGTVLPVWLGTTTGMLIADGIGIGVGVILHRHIPERAIQWCAALLFLAFGLWGVHDAFPDRRWLDWTLLAATPVLLLLLYAVARRDRQSSAAETVRRP